MLEDVAVLLDGPGVQRFRGGLVSKAHRLGYKSTLGSKAIKKKRRERIE